VEKIEEAIKETITWLDNNMEAEKEEYEDKKKEFESIIYPIFSKLGGGAGGFGHGGQGFGDDDEIPSPDDL